MRIQRLLFAYFVLALMLIGFQEPRPIPRHKPDGNPQHDNQPEFCVNHSKSGYAPNCECRAKEKCEDGKQAEDDGEPTGRESPHCKVYCRKDHCHCVMPCEG